MGDKAALAEITTKIQIVEDNLREFVEQAAAFLAPLTKSGLPSALPISRPNSMRFRRSARP